MTCGKPPRGSLSVTGGVECGMLKGLLTVAFLAAAGAAGYFGYVEFKKYEAAKRPVAAAPKTTEVTFIEAAPKDLAVTMDFVAQTESSQAVQSMRGSRVSLTPGTMSRGQLVRDGDVLFQMDPKPFEAALDQPRPRWLASRLP